MPPLRNNKWLCSFYGAGSPGCFATEVTACRVQFLDFWGWPINLNSSKPHILRFQDPKSKIKTPKIQNCKIKNSKHPKRENKIPQPKSKIPKSNSKTKNKLKRQNPKSKTTKFKTPTSQKLNAKMNSPKYNKHRDSEPLKV